jgi:hypothetical protein
MPTAHVMTSLARLSDIPRTPLFWEQICRSIFSPEFKPNENRKERTMDFTAPFPLIAGWIILAPIAVLAILNGIGGKGYDRPEYRVRDHDPVVPPRTL